LPLLRGVENAVDVLLHGSGGVRYKRSSVTRKCTSCFIVLLPRDSCFRSFER
jgi:hypothetical protein